MLLPRLQLVELEDQPWWPQLLRDAMTDYLQALIAWFDPYRPTPALLRDALRRTQVTEIVDLGSGGGGPWIELSARLTELGVDLSAVTLTDAFPNTTAFAHVERRTGGRVRGLRSPVDATAVPEALSGFRTMFTAFHHFPPARAEAILADAVRHRRGIAVFEMTTRSVTFLLGMPLLALLLLVCSPWIRPFRWSRLFWTYLVPVLPLATLVDAVVSSLRSYTPGELRALAARLGPVGYRWETGLICRPLAAAPVTYLIGTPESAK